MQLQKQHDFGLYIGALNIFIYSIAFLNILLTIIFQHLPDSNDAELVSDRRDESYLTFYKYVLLVFVLLMIITSVNLIRGIVKKSTLLIISWLVMSSCVLMCQFLFLLDQVIFYLSYGYVLYSPLMLLGLFIMFGLQILCIRKILKFALDLYKDQIQVLQSERISIMKNSTFKSKDYYRNIAQHDTLTLASFDNKELLEKYVKSNSVNLNKFEI